MKRYYNLDEATVMYFSEIRGYYSTLKMVWLEKIERAQKESHLTQMRIGEPDSFMDQMAESIHSTFIKF